MKRVLLYIGIAFAVIGCTKDQTTTPTDGVINLSAGVATRVAEGDDCAWAEGDEVGIFTDQGESNLLFTISDTATGELENASATPLYTLPSGARTFYAYHPYDSAQSDLTEPTKIEIDCTTDQSQPLLWATATTNETDVSLQFSHKLAKVSFTLTAGGVDVTSLEGATVTLASVNTKATFDIESGEFTITATADIDLEIGEDGTITAYLPPMDGVAESVKLWINVDGNIFVKSFTDEKWESGSSYAYDITVGEVLNMDYDSTTDTYQVYTAEGLLAFADLVNSGSTSINCTLMGDIDLGGIDSEGVGISGNEWTPIGSESSPYSGTFDGGGHIISGLYINSDSNYQGLFGYTSADAEISNLGVSGSVSGDWSVGGVVGRNYGTLTNCYNTGDVDGYAEVGGVVGVNDGTLTNCYNTASVSGGWEVGGVVGSNYDTLTNCYNTASVSGDTFVGGVAGMNYESTLTNCYNTASVSGSDGVGGVVGVNGDTLTNCYNTGVVNGEMEVGGVVGYNYGTLTNCYNTAVVDGYWCVGGVIGSNNVTLTNCYWDSEESDVEVGVGFGDDTTTPMTTEEMQAESFVVVLNNTAYDYNNPTDDDAPTVAACAWVYNEGDYPTLDFDAKPTQPEND